MKNNYEKIPFKTKKQWLELRRQGIGGSDVGAIMGVSSFNNKRDIYNSKIKGDTTKQNKAMEQGQKLEPPLVEMFEVLYGDVYQVELIKNYILRQLYNPLLQASLDALLTDKVTNEKGILEVKTTSVYATSMWYNEYGEFEPPLTYLLQGAHYLNVTGAKFVVYWVAVVGDINDDNSNYNNLIRILKPKIYRRKELEHLIRQSEKEATTFWREHIIPKEEPGIIIKM